MNTTSEVVRVKTAYAWVENQKFISLKAVGAKGAPVELTAEETRNLAERLLKLAQTLESLQSRAEEEE